MDMTGEFRIPAPRQQVWEALNDPETLKQCIPGCESMEKISDTEFAAKMLSKVGPVKARFVTRLTLSNLNPPTSYTIAGEGQGGVAGFAKGSADVTLEDEGPETVLRYAAQFQAGGKLAQVGSRLLGGTARKLADDFFGAFAARLSPQPAAIETPAEAAAPQPPAPRGKGRRVLLWVAAVAILIGLLAWAISAW
ncbi:MAG: carbon monoxide dehydrogenase subunit G [Acidiferrobacterales bacterium]